MGARRLTPRIKRAFLFYESEALLDLVAACRLAGFSRPSQSALMLRRNWSDEIAKVEDRVKSSVILGNREVMQNLSRIGADTAHPQQVRALEILARIHGMLSEKFDIRISRGDMAGVLAVSLERLRRSAELESASSTAEIPAPTASATIETDETS